MGDAEGPGHHVTAGDRLSEPVVRRVSEHRVQVDVGGRKFVVGSECPHRKGRLAYGFVNARKSRITCPLHHSTFDLASGCPVSGPTEHSLPVDAPDQERIVPESGGEGGVS
jgi:nitrite reductase/ring-hydroxylating ferredoxin subunit